VRGDKPHIAGHRITVADIVVMRFRMGQPLEEIATTCDLPVAAVYAAMAYSFDHMTEVDQSIAADEAYVEAMQHDNPSLLQKKLARLHDQEGLPVSRQAGD
jgi:uncharacterized protein (DUF433 family)